MSNTFTSALAAALMALWSHETGVGEHDSRWEPKSDEIDYMTQVFVDVASDRWLIDPKTDAILLAAVSWHESRVSTHPKDGDPLHLAGGDVGTVVGPMQVSKAAPGWIKLWPELRERWSGLTVDQMREPRVNVELARDILSFWKERCGGPPGVWLTAYGWGRCPTKRWDGRRSIDWEGRARCKTIRRIIEYVASREVGYETPLSFRCEYTQCRDLPGAPLPLPHQPANCRTN